MNLNAPLFKVSEEMHHFTSVVLHGGCELFMSADSEAQLTETKKLLVLFANKQRELIVGDPEVA